MKKKLRIIRLKAGALQLTIAFALMVMLVMLSYLLFNQLKGKETALWQIRQQLMRDLDSVVLILENSPEKFTQKESAFSVSDSVLIDTVKVIIMPWGFYHCVLLREEHQNQFTQRRFLFADDVIKNELKPSLYLSDPYRYLSVCGKTFLGSDTYLPGNGVRRAYVDGVGYYRDSLVQGSSFKSKEDLPLIASHHRYKYQKMTSDIKVGDSIVGLSALNCDTLINWFTERRLWVMCPEVATLRNLHCYGNIVFLGKDLEIKNTVSLENCIVMARNLKIERKFRGAAQFIIGHSIETGDSCTFLSPSVLNVEDKDSIQGISLGEGCRIEGDIILPSPSQPNTEYLKLGDNIRMIGQVYCNGLVSFKGIICGSLFCNGFLRRTPRGVFSNFLIDACIDHNRLPSYYGGVSLTCEENGKKCMVEIF